MPNSSKKFVNIGNARLDVQREEMERIVAAGHCPFCPENLATYHKIPNVLESKHWVVTPNQWPYENIKYQFLLIYRQHATKLSDLEPAAGQELLELLQQLEKKYDIPGGALGWRFGDTDYSAGSVSHLHAQLIVPDLDKPGYKAVRFKIGRSPEKKSQKNQ